jgi:hypothetical protein
LLFVCKHSIIILVRFTVSKAFRIFSIAVFYLKKIGGIIMATSTFDKRILLNKNAAEHLADLLSDDSPTERPDLTKQLEESNKSWELLLKRYEK